MTPLPLLTAEEFWQLAEPRSREVIVHTPDGRAQTYGSDDTLQGFDILPGFSCVVASLFR